MENKGKEMEHREVVVSGVDQEETVVHHDAANDDKRFLAAADATLREAESTWTVLKRNPRMVAVMLAVLLNGIIVGIENNMAGNMMGIQAFCRQFGHWSAADGEYVIPPHIISLWSACSSPFQLIGMVASGYVGDIVGRRPVLYSIILISICGALIESFVTTWQGWLGAKIVMLLATGLMQAGVGTYISEVAPRELRGVMLSTFNMFMNMGNLFAVLISYGAETTWSDVMDDKGFRVSLYVCVALPVVICLAELVFLVESPSWLVMHDRHDQARSSLKWLYPKASEEQLGLFISEIEYTLAKEKELAVEAKNTSFLDCFKKTDARRSFCAIFPALSQPLCGNMLCGPYVTYFLAMVGFTNSLQVTAIILCMPPFFLENSPRSSPADVKAIGFACNIVVYFIIDNKRVGRWAILFWGLVLMFIGDMGIGIVGSVKPDVKTSNAASGLVIFFTSVLVCGSVSGPGAVGWTYTGESGSIRLRAKTNTLGNLGNAAVSWVFASTISYIVTDIGLNSGYLFAGFAAVSVVITYLFIPDFTGRSFAQVDELFSRRIPARKFSSTEEEEEEEEEENSKSIYHLHSRRTTTYTTIK
ncbi:hypothetical protein ASPZODRAFT_162942 [Penicilliopsis zonata CBS 506.65]|uniref:Major facilitator superfamily (MFS) profile domain-containing protein n=1 Tax=Penicilliopsis zonata CBS 506.65 TaxID=1073090 RepID=A0A1L9SV40_9EURO|nr:hypothetical protein ASPZODRAFT_162942 [Penicilliopsis zonata CBS 506.65]OJJ51058.1 hypothetical protein ASPZODRAFT_162942 [Penicilliopsis zonata CBS 506.65]